MLKSIRKRETIKKIFKNGKVFDTSLFKVNYILSNGEAAGYALSVSKKLGIAVKRNRAKRVLKNALFNTLKLPLLCVIRLKKIDFTYYEAAEQFNFFQHHLTNKGFINLDNKVL